MFNSLSARLLVLTILFLMLAEVLILVSAVSEFRREWLEARLWDAQIASLAVAGAPGADPALSREALATAMVRGIAFTRADGRALVLGEPPDRAAGAVYDLRGASPLAQARDSWRTILFGSQGVVRVIGPARGEAGQVAVAIDEAPLHAELLGHARGMLLVSLLISVVVAGLIYFSLFRLLVRPLQELAANMAAFSAAPEDVTRVMPDSTRRDEIGTAQRSLRAMEDQVRQALAQKAGLASLGEAVAKVNHDLRNILATARLVSNRLSQNDDPGVRAISATLMQAIDRAIELCSDTLKFGRPQELRPRVIRFDLRPLVDEVGHSVGLSSEGNPMFLNHVDPHMEIDADPEHLFRALQNLMRNAAEAIGDGFGEIAIRCYDMGSEAVLEVSDTGPGLPDHARDNLFKPFKGSTHAHGAGLGLVNVREIMQAHGGEVKLLKSDAGGTIFRLHLPAGRKTPLRHAAG